MTGFNIVWIVGFIMLRAACSVERCSPIIDVRKGLKATPLKEFEWNKVSALRALAGIRGRHEGPGNILRLYGGGESTSGGDDLDSEQMQDRPVQAHDVGRDEQDGVRMFRCLPGDDVEPEPSFALRTPDQDYGVDYGAYGFMFDIQALQRNIIVTGMQICSADGTPRDYKVRTVRGSWRDAWKDESLWSVCGGGTRVYVPDHGHGEYGPLPWTDGGVEIECGEIRGFYVHGNNDEACVGYRLVGHVNNYAGRRRDAREAGGAEVPDLFVTDEDGRIALWSGRIVGEPEAFPSAEAARNGTRAALGGHALDDFVRGFLGIIEYELA